MLKDSIEVHNYYSIQPSIQKNTTDHRRNRHYIAEALKRKASLELPEKGDRFMNRKHHSSISGNSNSKNQILIRKHMLRDDNEKQNVFADKPPFAGNSELKAENLRSNVKNLDYS